jgi:Ca-activated chloride channel homolog
MSFEWPLALLGLALVPLALLGYVLVQRRRMRYAARFTNLDLLANVVERSPRWRRHLPPALALLALTALLVGLARPHAAIAVPREQATVVLAMDVSGSMAATDVEPTRLEAARSEAQRFLGQLPDELRVGVVSFSSEAQVLAAPSDGHAVVAETLDELRPGGGTAIGEAILRSLDLGLAAGDAAAARDTSAEPPLSILLLSDGANSAGTEPLEAAQEAQAAGVPVFTIALGTPEGTIEGTDDSGNSRTIAVPPDPEALTEVAERTGGRFFDAPSGDDLRSVYEEIGSQVGFETEEQEITFLFAAAGGLLLLLGGALSALWFNRIP